MTPPILYLKPGREKSLRQWHPWVYSGAVDRVEGDPQMGETVAVHSSQHEFLAWAAISPVSQIRARVWGWKEKETIGPEFFRKKIEQALTLRKLTLAGVETDAQRLIHGESDGLPGLVVDQYQDTLVLQILSAGAEYWKDVLADELVRQTGTRRVLERSDVDVRRLEGLPERVGTLYGPDGPDEVLIHEYGLTYQVNLRQGQKTGFYLDQRNNRRRVGELVRGRSVLNCFCYTGGFSLNALAGGASSVLSIDSSADALEMGKHNLELNHLPAEKAEWLCGDVFQTLRTFRDSRRSFDAIVLDPPKFAPTSAQAEKAARGYKDINLLAFKLLNPGGLLFTFSCSGGISPELFQKIVAGAAEDAQADAVIIERFSQAGDHPVSLAFPEGQYLKGLACWVKGKI